MILASPRTRVQWYSVTKTNKERKAETEKAEIDREIDGQTVR